MPLLFLEVPSGLHRDDKARLMRALTEVVDQTYRFPDTRVFIREYADENVCQDGAVGEPIKPVAFLEAPELVSAAAKRDLVVTVEEIIRSHYGGLADVEQTLILINEYPLGDVGWHGQLQSDNPMIVDAVERLNAAA